MMPKPDSSMNDLKYSRNRSENLKQVMDIDLYRYMGCVDCTTSVSVTII